MKIFSFAALAAAVQAGGHGVPQPEQWQIDQWTKEALDESPAHIRTIYEEYIKRTEEGITPRVN